MSKKIFIISLLFLYFSVAGSSALQNPVHVKRNKNRPVDLKETAPLPIHVSVGSPPNPAIISTYIFNTPDQIEGNFCEENGTEYINVQAIRSPDEQGRRRTDSYVLKISGTSVTAPRIKGIDNEHVYNLSPNGRLAYIGGGKLLDLRTAENLSEIVRKKIKPEDKLSEPAFSNNGQFAGYTHYEKAQDELGSKTFFILNSEDNSVVEVPIENKNMHQPSWVSSDGKLFAASHETGGTTKLGIFNLKGKLAYSSENDFFRIIGSHDGKTIALTSGTPPKENVKVYSLPKFELINTIPTSRNALAVDYHSSRPFLSVDGSLLYVSKSANWKGIEPESHFSLFETASGNEFHIAGLLEKLDGKKRGIFQICKDGRIVTKTPIGAGKVQAGIIDFRKLGEGKVQIQVDIIDFEKLIENETSSHKSNDELVADMMQADPLVARQAVVRLKKRGITRDKATEIYNRHLIKVEDLDQTTKDFLNNLEEGLGSSDFEKRQATSKEFSKALETANAGTYKKMLEPALKNALMSKNAEVRSRAERLFAVANGKFFTISSEKTISHRLNMLQ